MDSHNQATEPVPTSVPHRRIGRKLFRIAAAGLSLLSILSMPAMGIAQSKRKSIDPSEAPVLSLTPTQQPAEKEPLEGPVYHVTRFMIDYAVPHPDLPATEKIMTLVIRLGQKEGCYVAEARGDSPLSLRLADLPDLGMQRFHHSAIQSINSQIVVYLNRRGLIGINAAPSSLDVDETGKDIRPEGATVFHIEVTAALVESVRSQALGARFDSGEIMNNDAHERIRALSPIYPAKEDDAERHDLIQKDRLNDYLFRLNRHPGRRVDAAVTPGDAMNRIKLDYLVTEKKPWLAYFQGSNTGTEKTKDWRWRLGFVHNQLLNRDDILSIDYITTDIDSPESRVVLGSYEAPFFDSETVRWSLYGFFSRFRSSTVPGSSEFFRGETRKMGAELFINIYQNNDFFTDLTLGLRQDKFEVRNKTILLDGEEEMLFPGIGIRFEKRAEQFSTTGKLTFEKMLDDASRDELTPLGRLKPATDWSLVQGEMTYAFFLEPLLNREAWEDIRTPESSTLAHEMFFSIGGQHTFGKRVIPQFEGVLGGAYSVRGYPTAAVAGDSTLVSSLEYRFHLPRSMEIEPDPSRTPLFGQSFRFAPQQVYGRPDWDLVFRAFVDAGSTWQADILEALEENESPVGTGIGIEFLFKNNLSLRADWGFALSKVNEGKDDEVEAGDNRFHLAFTVLF